MNFHPIANLLPLHQLPSLTDSIKRYGLIEPIITYQGMILDGRQRYTGCEAAGVEPVYEEYAGQCGDPVAFVKAKNIDRRQLTTLERVNAAAALLAYWRAELAKVGRERGERGGNYLRNKAAETFETSPASVARMDTINRNGVPELQEAVQAQRMGLEEAARISQLTPEQQLEELTSIDAEEQAADAKEEGPADRKTLRRLQKRVRSVYTDSPAFSDTEKEAAARHLDGLDELVKQA